MFTLHHSREETPIKSNIGRSSTVNPTAARGSIPAITWCLSAPRPLLSSVAPSRSSDLARTHRKRQRQWERETRKERGAKYMSRGLVCSRLLLHSALLFYPLAGCRLNWRRNRKPLKPTSPAGFVSFALPHSSCPSAALATTPTSHSATRIASSTRAQFSLTSRRHSTSVSLTVFSSPLLRFLPLPRRVPSRTLSTGA